jgi:hypothetical protein
VRDQLIVGRSGRDRQEQRWYRIAGEPELRLLVVDEIGETQRQRRRIDRVDI